MCNFTLKLGVTPEMAKMEEVYHIPALLEDTVNGLNISPEGIYVDATMGGCGHSRAILERLVAPGHLYSFDQDMDAIERAISDPLITPVHSNFRFISNFMRFYGHTDDVSGILADLGVSFHHFDDPERGFSFRWEGPLDMRMNRRSRHDASWLLNNLDEQRLADIFYLYGELKNARKIAAAITRYRSTHTLTHVEHLLDVVRPLINPRQEKKELAQIFQALRIAVNDEIQALRELLLQSVELLRPGGRLAIITYHSLEDRLVKNFMKTGNMEGTQEKDFFGRTTSPLRLLSSKPIVPSEEEIERNPRSRSAKLRIAEKI